MFDVIEVVRRIEVPRAPSIDELPTEDGEPLESNWHRVQINLLVDISHQLWPGLKRPRSGPSQPRPRPNKRPPVTMKLRPN